MYFKKKSFCYSEHELDQFKSIVVVDIGTRNYYDTRSLENTLYSHIRDFHRIGNVTADLDNFNFVEFQGLFAF